MNEIVMTAEAIMMLSICKTFKVTHNINKEQHE